MRVAVIGGGTVGLSLAIALVDSGAQVTLLDGPAHDGMASLGNAGHIAVEQDGPLASPATLRRLGPLLFGSHAPVSAPLGSIRSWGPWSLGLLRACTPEAMARGRAALTWLLADALPAWERLVERAGARGQLLRQGHRVVWETPEAFACDAAGLARRPSPLVTWRRLGPGEIAELRRRSARAIAAGMACEGTARSLTLPTSPPGPRARITDRC